MTDRRRRSYRLATAATCALALLPAAAAQAADDNDAPAEHRVHLTSAQTVEEGDLYGYGDALVRQRKDEGEVCWDVSWRNLDSNVTAVHLHKGALGEDGPHVLEMLADGSEPGDFGSTAGCTNPDNADEVEEMLADPSGYYVQVHTVDHEDGAIRGQFEQLDEDTD